jgi:repressor LexA
MISGVPGDLIPQQRRVLDWVGAHVLQFGRPPSYRETAAALGMRCHSTAQHHMCSLRRLGYVRWTPGRSQTLEFFHPDGTWHPVPPPKIK